jgi:hypothetical protein
MSSIVDTTGLLNEFVRDLTDEQIFAVRDVLPEVIW